MNLSPNFTLQEFIYSETASRYNIDNIPTDPEVLSNLLRTADNLENIRSLLDKPMYISSAYRCLELNRKIGSKDTSQHILGKAVDFKCPRFGTPKQIIDKIMSSEIDFDQLILEYDNWVHVSFTESENRRQVLVIDSNGTKPYL
jgi:hypothetical protein